MVSAFCSSVLPRGQAFSSTSPPSAAGVIFPPPFCLSLVVLLKYLLLREQSWLSEALSLKGGSRHFLSLDGGSPDYPTLPYAPSPLLLSEVSHSTLQMTDFFSCLSPIPCDSRYPAFQTVLSGHPPSSTHQQCTFNKALYMAENYPCPLLPTLWKHTLKTMYVTFHLSASRLVFFFFFFFLSLEKVATTWKWVN